MSARDLVVFAQPGNCRKSIQRVRAVAEQSSFVERPVVAVPSWMQRVVAGVQ